MSYNICVFFKRIKLLFLLFLNIYSNCALDNDVNTSNQTVLKKLRKSACISLGYSCQVAHQLNRANLRNCAFPFDWCFTPYNGLYLLIKNNFKSFFKKSNLKKLITDVQETGYGLTFVHDFPTIDSNELIEDGTKHIGLISDNFLEAYERVKDKYNRRIERLKKILMTNGPIYLFRAFEISKNEAIKLKNLLVSKFPKLNFLLTVLNDTDEFKKPWNIERLKNFWMLKAEDWAGNDQDWDRVFIQLKLI